MSGYNLPGGCMESHIDALSDDERPAICDRCGSQNDPGDMTLSGHEDLCPACISGDNDGDEPSTEPYFKDEIDDWENYDDGDLP